MCGVPTHRIEIENPPEERVTVHLFGPQFRNVNDELLHACFGALLQCADLGTIAAHNAQTQCCQQAFGIAAR